MVPRSATDFMYYRSLVIFSSNLDNNIQRKMSLLIVKSAILHPIIVRVISREYKIC